MNAASEVYMRQVRFTTREWAPKTFELSQQLSSAFDIAFLTLVVVFLVNPANPGLAVNEVHSQCVVFVLVRTVLGEGQG